MSEVKRYKYYKTVMNGDQFTLDDVRLDSDTIVNTLNHYDALRKRLEEAEGLLRDVDTYYGGDRNSGVIKRIKRYMTTTQPNGGSDDA